MKLIIDTTTGIERSETRTEILARHARQTAAHADKMAFLDGIKRECFDIEAIELDARLDWNEYRQDLADKGLVTLINTSTELMPVADIVERCSDILRRNFGFRNGVLRTEDKQGARDEAEEMEGKEKEFSARYTPAWPDKVN